MAQEANLRGKTMEFSTAYADCPLIAVLRWITPDESEAACAALIAAGFRIIEIPLNSPDALVSIGKVAKAFAGQALIGAGTVMSAQSVQDVAREGGRLIVTPHGDVEVVRAAKALDLACVPGVATPTEGFAALAAGADGLKLFPAETIPPAAVKAWRAVFARTIPLFPTGGITPAAMADYFAAGASGFGTGSLLFTPGQDPEETELRARAYVEAWRALSPGPAGPVAAASGF